MFNLGAIPHVADIEGRKEFKRRMILEIEKLGGSAKESESLENIREKHRRLGAKLPPAETKKEEPKKAETPAATIPEKKKSRK